MLIINILFQAFKIIIMLSILVIIHELGHFTVAKLFKIPVKEFSVGFGKKLFSKEKNGTIYSIRIFLLGGFVDIDDESRQGSFSTAPLYQKNLILIAGVFVNFIFAVILGVIVLFVQGEFISNRVEFINPEAPIYSQGIQVGDQICRINGKKIQSKNQIDTIMYSNNGEKIDLVVKRGNEKYNYLVSPYKKDYLIAGFTVDENNIVIDTQKDKTNILVGDKIISVNDILVNSIEELTMQLENNIDLVTKIEVDRNGERLETEAKVEVFSKYYIGVGLAKAKDTTLNKIKYSFIGIEDYIYETFRGMILLITGQSKNAELMGIVGVSEIITKTTNITEYLGIMVSISLSLAIVNLFPLPLLDGGKIVLYTIEKYRKKEFSEKFINIISTATIVILVIVTIYVMIKDIIRII